MGEWLGVGAGAKEWREFSLLADLFDPALVARVCVVNGRMKGPRVYVGGGLHGDEYNGMEAVRSVALEIDPSNLNGGVVAVPIQNPIAFHQYRRTLAAQLDDSDMNRVFPGSPDGSFGARIAYRLYSELVAQCDYVIDLHSATTGDSWAPVANLPREGEVLEKSRELVRAFGPRVWLEVPVRGSLVGAAGAAGKPGLIVELGSGGLVERDFVEVGKRGVLQVLGHLGMIDSRSSTDGSPLHVAELRPVRTRLSGLIYLDVGLGDFVVEGDAIGSVVWPPDYRESLVAPCSGLVTRIAKRGMVAAGDSVVILAPVSERA